MSAPIQFQPTLKPGTPTTLFQGNYFSNSGRNWCLSKDGDRFLMIKEDDAATRSSSTELIIVENWIEVVRQKASS